MGISTGELENSIRTAFTIFHLEILDQSSGCGENYSVFIVSSDFEGKNTLARHRLVNEVLKKEIAEMHAFSQRTLTPKQYEAHLARQTAAAS